MPLVLGADGAKGGYAVACVDLDRSKLTMLWVPSAEALLAIPCDLLAVDMPIGLTEDRVRPCDTAARGRLPGRAS